MSTSSGYDANDELIRVCGEFEALEWQYRANREQADGNPDAERIDDEIAERQNVLEPSMLDLRATTLEALQARARALVSWAPDLLDDGGDLGGQLTAATLRDLVGAEWLAKLVGSMTIGAPTVRPARPGPWVPEDGEVVCASLDLVRAQDMLEKVVDGDPSEDVDIASPAIAALFNRRDELLKRVTGMAATTRSGMVFKARAALRVISRNEDGQPERDMFQAILRSALEEVARQRV